MSTDLTTHNIITLKDGTELTERQSRAVFLHATEDLSMEEIAKQVGYASGSAGVRKFLKGERGKEAVRTALIDHLQEGGRTGLRTTISLAKNAKSENVRQLAAQKLVEWSRIADEVAPASPLTRGPGGLNIQINIGEGKPSTLIEGEASPLYNGTGGPSDKDAEA